MPLAIKYLMQISTQEMSWIVSIYSLGIVLTRPFSGFIADKFGKKKISFLLFLLFAICTLSYFSIQSFYLLIFMRFLHGITHSISTTAHAAMAVDFSPNHMKGQGIGYYGLAMCLAMVAAPALGLYILEKYDYHTFLILATATSFIGTIITYFIDSDKPTEEVKNKSFSFNDLIEIKALPIGILALILSFGYSGIIAFIAIFLKEQNVENGSIYFYISFAITMILARPFIGKIIDKKGANFLMYPSIILLAIGIALIGFTDSLTMVLFTGLILGLSYGCVFPSFQTHTVQSCSPSRTGSAMGTFYLFYDLGFGIGAIILAKVATHMGYTKMYFLISVLILVMALLYFLMRSAKVIKVIHEIPEDLILETSSSEVN